MRSRGAQIAKQSQRLNQVRARVVELALIGGNPSEGREIPRNAVRPGAQAKACDALLHQPPRLVEVALAVRDTPELLARYGKSTDIAAQRVQPKSLLLASPRRAIFTKLVVDGAQHVLALALEGVVVQSPTDEQALTCDLARGCKLAGLPQDLAVVEQRCAKRERVARLTCNRHRFVQ